MHILKHIRMRSIRNPCIRERCGKSAFHGAHSDAMCLSVANAEILVKSWQYLDRSLHDKTMSRICPLAQFMTGGRISPFDLCLHLDVWMTLSRLNVVNMDVFQDYRKVAITGLDHILCNFCSRITSLSWTCVRF